MTSEWGPEVIGYAVSGLLYGVTLGQSVCYTYWFPDDHRSIKVLVIAVVLADTAQFIGSTHFLWAMLISCHRSYSWNCTHEINWSAYVSLGFYYHIVSVVDCFYCHRIWTISGRNKPLTLIVLVIIILGYVLATWYFIDVVRVGTLDYMFASPLILPYSGTNTLCDFFITFTVFRYMWKSSFRRRRSVVQDLARVCVYAGAFTCMLAIIIGILVLIQGGNYWGGAASFVFSRSYVISLLVVLNARKIIRDRERDANVIELTTIPVALEPGSSNSHQA